jgi:hypothetical protein
MSHNGSYFKYGASFAANHCPAYKAAGGEGVSGVCGQCKQSTLFHKLIISKQEERSHYFPALKLFCALRNFRRSIFMFSAAAATRAPLQEEVADSLRGIRQCKGLADLPALVQVAARAAAALPLPLSLSLRPDDIIRLASWYLGVFFLL